MIEVENVAKKLIARDNRKCFLHKRKGISTARASTKEYFSPYQERILNRENCAKLKDVSENAPINELNCCESVSCQVAKRKGTKAPNKMEKKTKVSCRKIPGKRTEKLQVLT